MNLDRIRLRLTLGYVTIFALTVLLLEAVAVIGFWQELVHQQDDPLRQEARNQAQILLNPKSHQDLAKGSNEFGWVALKPDGRIIARDPTSPKLGLPASNLARETLQDGGPVFATVRGPRGESRAVSMPMREGKKVVGMIQYARSLEGARQTVGKLVLVLLPLSLGALGVAAAGGAYMAGRAVRPVRRSFEQQRTFIADASHELKTPLTMIRADTEVLRRGIEDSGDAELADDVLAETDRMSAVLSDLLLVARLDADKLPMESKDFDLGALISEVTARFEKQASPPTGPKFEVKIPQKLLACGDRARTERILSALLENALMHAPQAGKVTVSAHLQDEFIEIEVKDTGDGISPENLPHIFERFYRVDTARSRASGGTGLGLSIARDLARAQGGNLTAENAGDGGAVFRLKLPRPKSKGNMRC